MAKQPGKSPRVFLDANILISGTVFPRWPYEILQHGLKGDLRVVLAPYVIEEARRVIAAKFPDYVERFEEFLSILDYEEVPDPTPEEVRQADGISNAPEDVPVGLAAIKAGVEYLVSEDKHLTGRHPGTNRLHDQVNVLISGAFLREVMGWTGGELEEVRGRSWESLDE